MADMAWKCPICGYVHRGAGRPDLCPLCGAAGDEFEPFSEAVAETAADRAPERWRCLNCQYEEAGSIPPAVCPVCGALADRFEPVADSAITGHVAGDGFRAIILGSGIAGVAAAESLRAANPNADILLISKEDRLPYYRLNLTRYLAGDIAETELSIHPENWYAQQRIDLCLGAEAAGLDPVAKTVRLRNGAVETYDRLLLAPGSHPFVPPIPGATREGVMTLRTQTDANRLLEAVKGGAHCVCIGGGLLGLETAAGLVRRGASVTVLEGFSWLLPRQLDAVAGARLALFLKDLGLAIRMPVKVEEITGDEHVHGVRLADGAILPADLVVVAAGVRPNSYLARQAGLSVNQGVIVDNLMRTSHPDIFAAGDIAEHRSGLYGTWSPSRFQGALAGMNMAGAGKEFGGIPRSHTLKVLGVDLFSIGVVSPEDASYEIVAQETREACYRLVFRDSHLAGAVLLGDARYAAAIKKAVENKTDLSSLQGRHLNTLETLEAIAALT